MLESFFWLELVALIVRSAVKQKSLLIGRAKILAVRPMCLRTLLVYEKVIHQSFAWVFGIAIVVKLCYTPLAQ